MLIKKSVFIVEENFRLNLDLNEPHFFSQPRPAIIIRADIRLEYAKLHINFQTFV